MPDIECKLLCWRGGVLQKLGNSKVYAVLYGVVGLIHFAVNSYQLAIISTVEKRFSIPSKISGLIISGWDIGTCVCVLYLAFYGNRLHKPKAVTFGMLLIASSCILWILPHVIYGRGISDSKIPVESFSEWKSEKCELGDLSKEICNEGDESLLSSLILISANILFGCGTCFYWTLGLAFMDDNAKKNKTPVLLALSMLIRMVGPTLGYMLASYTLSIPVDLSNAADINEEDPRWIGAWWLGFIPLFTGVAFLSVLMWGFPRHLPQAYKRKIDSGKLIEDSCSETRFKYFRLLVGRLLKNKIFMFNTISSTFYVFGMMGFGTFGPKYLEAQFQKSPSEASFITGTIGLLCTGLGVFSSGLVISVFKPKPRQLALWNVITESLDVIGQMLFAFLGCPIENLQGHWDSNKWSLQEECNNFCSCPLSIKYTPVCLLPANQLFYSPCHAGCHTGSFNSTLKVYENCICSPTVPIATGPCPVNEKCNHEFYVYLIIICLLKFFSASGRAGNTILQFRSVREGDKAVSIGVTEAIMSIFAFIPAPIIFGALLDDACIVWDESCGKTGHCWLYDGRTMRFYLNFTTSGFLFLGTLADIVVWLHSSDLELYDEEVKDIPQLQQLGPTSEDL